jgi:secreted PhoX family phosphatase
MTFEASIKRRDFLAVTGTALGLGFTGLHRVVHGNSLRRLIEPNTYGSLKTDPSGVIDLPEGFRYQVFSTQGQEMNDGLLVPGLHDGMATFPADDGCCLLIRNHEIGTSLAPRFGAFGWQNERLDKVDATRLYDSGTGSNGPSLGGTTSILFDLKSGAPRAHWLSLGGTGLNCAGGPTPWHSWISCEEWTQRADLRHARDHGYAFEVPATTDIGLSEPRPLTAMGRFNREAIAVDPATGIVYQTEDRQDGAFYRFIPTVPGALDQGGRLQALAISDERRFDTRNWNNDGTDNMLLGSTLSVSWVDLDVAESPEDDLRYRSHDAGCARFARGEGIWMGNGQLHFVCTTGGVDQNGQVFSYVPSPHEGTARESEAPGRLTLFIQPSLGSLVTNADNLTIAPSGDLFLCEDGSGSNGMARVTPDGIVERFAENRMNNSELAGACFSPDGSTLFVNIQRPGLSIAINGPWHHA